MRITYDAKVGIGTTSPSTKFVVSNAGAEGLEIGHTSGTVEINAYNRSGSARSPIDIVGQTFKVITGNPGLSTGLFQDSSGKVGIGTSSPNDILSANYTVPTNGSNGLRLQDNTNTTVTVLGTTHTAYNYAGVSGHHSLLYGARNLAIVADGANSGDIKFAAGNAIRMFIKNNGRVGINVTSPANVLEIKNTTTTIHPASFRMTGAHQYASAIMDNDGANGGGSATFISCRMSNSIKGDIVFNGSVMVYGGQSDYRLKRKCCFYK